MAHRQLYLSYQPTIDYLMIEYINGHNKAKSSFIAICNPEDLIVKLYKQLCRDKLGHTLNIHMFLQDELKDKKDDVWSMLAVNDTNNGNIQMCTLVCNKLNLGRLFRILEKQKNPTQTKLKSIITKIINAYMNNIVSSYESEHFL